MAKKSYVAYYRVSTKKQAVEMKPQKTAVKNYLKGSWPPIKSFIEIESGAKSDRPEFKKALQYCYETNSTLIVAKLDRLSRDLEFIGWIQNTDINFVCCDMPKATRETIGLMGVMARWEREIIVKRTKEALAEKKKAGVKLGAHNPKVLAGLKRFRKNQAIAMAKKLKKLEAIKKLKLKKNLKAKEKKALLNTFKYKPVVITQREIADKAVWPTIKTLREQGFTYEGIAQALEKSKLPTRQGGKWSQTAVIRIVKRNNG